MKSVERSKKVFSILLAGLMIFSMFGWTGAASAFPRQGAMYLGKMASNFDFSEAGIGAKELYVEVDGGPKQTIILNEDYSANFNPMPDLLGAISSQISGAQAYSQGEGYPLQLISDSVGPESSLMVYGPAAPYLGFDTVTVVEGVYGASWMASDIPSEYNFLAEEPTYFDIEVDKGEAQEICLDADYTDMNGLLSAINDQLSGAAASAEEGKLKITSDSLNENSSVVLKYAPFTLGFSFYQPGLSASTDFESFSFEGLDSLVEGSIDPDNFTINATVPHGTDVTDMAASFEAAEGTIVLVDGVEQVSGSTVNDFTNPVTYTLNDPNAEFGPETQDWVVTVTVEEAGGAGSGEGSGGDSSTPGTENTTGTVDPSRGGTVEAGNGSLKLDFPTGALDAENQVQVTVKTLTQTDANIILKSAVVPEGVKSIGRVFEFKAEVGTGEDRKYINTFAKPVILTLKLDAGDLKGISDPQKVGLFKLMDDGTLVFIGGRVIDNKLVLEMSGFSRYVLAEVKFVFNDLEKHWSKEDVELMASKYVVRGYPGSIFAPEGKITRAEFTSMVVNLMGLHKTEDAISFNDVKRNDWFYGAVQSASGAGVIKGNSDGSFRPDEPVTREQMAVIIAQALNAKDGRVMVTDKEAESLMSAYSDFGQVSNWAIGSMAVTVQESIIRGKTQFTLAPRAAASRAEAAVMIAMLWKN